MPKLIRRSGFFDLLGLDFIVSTNKERAGKLLLLEVNTNPALSLGEYHSIGHIASDWQ